MLGCGVPTHFLTSPPSPHSPHLSLHLPYLPHTPTHFRTPPLIPLPTFPLPPLAPQHTLLHLSPHLPHLLKEWRSYHVTKFLWRSYHVAKLLATTYLSCLKTKCSKTLIPVLVLRFISCLSGSPIPYCCSNIIYIL